MSKLIIFTLVLVGVFLLIKKKSGSKPQDSLTIQDSDIGPTSEPSQIQNDIVKAISGGGPQII